MNYEAIDKEVAAGYIGVQKHPTCDLRIYNYTQRCQFEWHWTPETMACRGLIVDGNNCIVARPFQKFFSYEQLNGQVPNEPFEVFEKLDGSLGVLYWEGDTPRIATRGSFVSMQALAANSILKTKYASVAWNKNLTYLFEIIYPENRIVVDYGDTADLFLLAVIGTKSGLELPLPSSESIGGMPVVKRYDGISDFAQLLEANESNQEGFVVRFASGTRVKIKMAEYKRLHKLLTGINARHIWEIMRSRQSIAPLLERVPDEYFSWVNETITGLHDKYREVEASAAAEFRNDFASRKDAAMHFKGCKYPSILFSMLDGKDYSDQIWRLIRPQGERAFRCDMDA